MKTCEECGHYLDGPIEEGHAEDCPLDDEED